MQRRHLGADEAPHAEGVAQHERAAAALDERRRDAARGADGVDAAELEGDDAAVLAAAEEGQLADGARRDREVALAQAPRGGLGLGRVAAGGRGGRGLRLAAAQRRRAEVGLERRHGRAGRGALAEGRQDDRVQLDGAAVRAEREVEARLRGRVLEEAHEEEARARHADPGARVHERVAAVVARGGQRLEELGLEERVALEARGALEDERLRLGEPHDAEEARQEGGAGGEAEALAEGAEARAGDARDEQAHRAPGRDELRREEGLVRHVGQHGRRRGRRGRGGRRVVAVDLALVKVAGVHVGKAPVRAHERRQLRERLARAADARRELDDLDRAARRELREARRERAGRRELEARPLVLEVAGVPRGLGRERRGALVRLARALALAHHLRRGGGRGDIHVARGRGGE